MRVALRERGIDVTTAEDAGLQSAPDLDHLEYARRKARVIFSQDADFLALHKAGHPHAGIVYCRQQSRTIGQIVRALAQLWELCDADDLAGHVEFI